MELPIPTLKQLEKAKVNAENAIDDTLDFFCIVDRAGKILRGNHSAATWFEIGHEELLNHSLSEIFTPATWDRFSTFLDQLEKELKRDPENAANLKSEFELAIDGKKSRNRSLLWSARTLLGTSAQMHTLFVIFGRDASSSVVLEKKNTELEFQNNRIQAILDSALQGFITFNEQMLIEGDFSQRAEDLFGKDVAGKNICDVLNLDPKTFPEFVSVVFKGADWDLLKNFSKYQTEVQGKTLKIDIAPIIELNKVKRLLAAITDVTQLTLFEKKSEKTAQTARTLIKILQSKPLFIDLLRSVERATQIKVDQSDAKNIAHTLKGEFGFFECVDFVNICHSWESKWKNNFDDSEYRQFITEVQTAIEKFLDEQDEVLRIRGVTDDEFLATLTSIKALVAETIKLKTAPQIFAAVEHLLEKPLKDQISWLNEYWLMTAETLGKKVNPLIWLDSSPIFADAYKKLFSTLVHAIQNAADHGMEYPQERTAANKPKRGTLTAQLQLIEGVFHLYLRDDGRGLNLEQIKEIAQKKGVKMPENGDISSIIFQEDFSTKSSVTVVSGRGIGLSAILSEARVLGGDAKAQNLATGGLELHISFRKKSLSEIFPE